MYICIYVYMYICIYVYMYICIYVYMYICIYVYMYICIYVYMYICIYVYMYIIYMYICIYICICIYMYIYILHVYMYTYICVCMICICIFVFMYIHRPILLWNDHNPFMASPKFRPKDMGKTRVLPGPGDYSQADFWDPKKRGWKRIFRLQPWQFLGSRFSFCDFTPDFGIETRPGTMRTPEMMKLKCREFSRSPIINSGIFTSDTFPGVAKITPGALTKKMESHGKPYG